MQTKLLNLDIENFIDSNASLLFFNTNFFFNIKIYDLILLPEFFLSSNSVILIIYCSLIAYNKSHSYNLIQISVFSLCILIILSTLFLILNDGLNHIKYLSYDSFFLNNFLTIFAKLVTITISLLSIYLLQDYVLHHNQINNMEYNLLCTYSLFGLIILLATNDFTTIFLTLELQSLSFYVLSRFKKDTIFSINNGLKYFILGSLSSSYFLLGWNLLYGFSCLSLISNYFVIFILYEISQNNCIPINNKNTHVLENIRITLKISDKPESILYKAGIDEELLTKALIGLKKELLLVSASAEKKPINNYYNKAGVSALEHLYWWDGVKVKNPDHLPPSFLLPFPSLVDQYDLNNRGVTRKGRVIKNAIDSYVVWHNFYWSLTFRENKHKLAEVYKKCMVIMIVMLESYTHKGFENQQQQWKIQYLLKLSFVTPEIALTVVKELASKSEN